MRYRFEFRAYQRPFKHPLATSHGLWTIREGIILRLTDEAGRIGWGEVAPIPWFGSESWPQALDFCQRFASEITTTDIFSIPDQLPACQFGLESAWERVRRGNSSLRNVQPCLDEGETRESKLAYSCLLPTGEAALESWQIRWSQGHRTFKWKIGVAPIQDELKLFHQLVQALPPSVQLRLDANGGLNQQEAHQWLQAADQVGRVEFLEQPLTPPQFDTLLEMSEQYSTPIALDESVATLSQLESCYRRGWRGIFVIKAAIAGSPQRLRQFCQTHPIDSVFSSVLETAIAKQAALQLAVELSHPNRAVGYGVNHWFEEDDKNLLQRLWNNP